jgi:hypothetical protein
MADDPPAHRRLAAILAADVAGYFGGGPFVDEDMDPRVKPAGGARATGVVVRDPHTHLHLAIIAI